MKYKLILFLFLSPILLFGQKNANTNLDLSSSHNVGDCFGAIKVATNASIYVELFGDGGKIDDFKNNEQYLEDKETNSIWFSSKSSVSGYLSVTLKGADFPMDYVAFRLDENDNCESIHSGSLSPIQLGEVEKNNALVFMLDSIKLTPGQRVIFCINSKWSEKSNFVLISTFTDEISKEAFAAMQKVHDFRSDLSQVPFEVKIRDASTYLPIVSNVIISGSRRNDALYTVSDFIFPYAPNLKLKLKIDAKGYLHNDGVVDASQLFLKEYIILLDPIMRHKFIEMEGMGFVTDSDILLPDAYPKIQRLKDFMANNSGVEIEIQGHVHIDGRNSFRAKRMSKKRAETVREYLINSGIKKSRMTVVGFGGARMKFPEPKNEDEVQMNRRVEVKIK